MKVLARRNIVLLLHLTLALGCSGGSPATQDVADGEPGTGSTATVGMTEGPDGSGGAAETSGSGGSVSSSPCDIPGPTDPAADFSSTGLVDARLDYPAYTPNGTERVLSRARYFDQLQGFWLAQSIANWTGLITEMDRTTSPFYTDDKWGQADEENIWGFLGHQSVIDFYIEPEDGVWGSDDDTDIEYIYHELLYEHQTSILTPEQIRDGWLTHISPEEENYLWVSNQNAFDLMSDGMLPPDTSEPENNPGYLSIDAQLTTELFGVLAPARPDQALRMAHLPIRTTAKDDAEWVSEFYVLMHSLASSTDPSWSNKDKVFWLAERARTRLPADSYVAKMYDFVRSSYEGNPDKSDWESTRDAVFQKYQASTADSDGYVYVDPFDSGINFAASLVSLFYGEGDLARTIQIGTLAGWDSDNPTATWGGLLGLMMGKSGVEQVFGTSTDNYSILRTRQAFPDRNGEAPGEDSFTLMAERGLYIIDRVVLELGGGVDLENDLWYIPETCGAFE